MDWKNNPVYESAQRAGAERLKADPASFQELEFKTSDQSEEAESLRSELKHVQEELEGTMSQSIALRRALEKAEEDKSHAEQRMNKCIRRMEKTEHMTKIAERAAKRAIEIALETGLVRGFMDTPPDRSSMGPTRIKRTFQDAGTETPHQDVPDLDIDTSGAFKRNKTDLFDNGRNMYEGEEGGSGATSSEVVDNTNYRKLTIAKLKQRMTEAGFGAEILARRNPSKKDLLEMYERLMLRKPPAH